eukprot:1333745-Amorphochlora_amoeboformis.AAC.1
MLDGRGNRWRIVRRARKAWYAYRMCFRGKWRDVDGWVGYVALWAYFLSFGGTEEEINLALRVSVVGRGRGREAGI